MKSFCVLFVHPPYGSNIVREGLNFSLNIFSYTSNINIFFLGDGIFQIIKNQYSEKIYCNNNSFNFSFFEKYHVKNIYVCSRSLHERGFFNKDCFLIKVKIIDINRIRKKIKKCNFILRF
ncbi:sulfurtransferase complex subunit TusC [Buchnera aphidicola (Kurisakia onigurumii)]|uniref:sulfurtransferase complex subunit TusC n=1 Tax=Buchnera aphidicola TaxID=9 RepID=UPI0031B73435